MKPLYSKTKWRGVKRTTIRLCIILSFLLCLDHTQGVLAWSNGGFSDDPANPDYGTHDYLAEHALDFLPYDEKSFILVHLNTYLYGTELPDNYYASDGIGDRIKHHVYFDVDGTLLDDSSAVRAQEEYESALNYLLNNDTYNASKTIGIMSHYIVDVGSFGHVMGKNTPWGEETHHEDYEDYVNDHTSSYDSPLFDPYLIFDGKILLVDAYNATLMIAYNTTFGDGDKTKNCTWMDDNYNWSNPEFVDSCGATLNRCVNLLADVIHTLIVTARQMQQNEPPMSVTLYTPAEVTATSILIRWSQNTDTDFYAYEVHISQTQGFIPTQSTLVARIEDQSRTSYNITGLTPNTTYYIKVVVVDTSGLKRVSNELSATTSIDSDTLNATKPPEPPKKTNNDTLYLICFSLLMIFLIYGIVLNIKRRKRSKYKRSRLTRRR